ncbi:biotin--[acetyl-CoA-carboxylase] ligase [Tellurirhabdus rosea]|uniref:biotin--[acetyl-CoA-carboxylase] ligase n=1 Tax=Tellurirhabdus rosea TaxID=2674997 RepID=UPI002B1CDFEA
MYPAFFLTKCKNKLYNNQPKTLILGQTIQYLPTCQSTNDVASELILNGQASEGLLVITHHQTAGRGQRGNPWEARPGENLTFSLVLQPSFLQASEQFWLNIAISLGISDWLVTHLHERMRIKWPNDLYVDNRKIGGILIENTLQGYSIAWSVVGIGININQTRFSHPNATSLLNETPNDGEFVLENSLNSIAEALEKRYLALRSGRRDVLKAEYLQRLFRYQEEAEYVSDGERFRGSIVGVGETGLLAIETAGRLRYFGFKEVEFVI